VYSIGYNTQGIFAVKNLMTNHSLKSQRSKVRSWLMGFLNRNVSSKYVKKINAMGIGN